MMEKLDEGFKHFILKIMIPALVAISIKLAVMSRKVKLSFVLVVSSYVIGVGTVYLVSDFVLANCSPHLVTIMSGVIAITSEKIATYFIYKFNVDIFISSFFDTLISRWKK